MRTHSTGPGRLRLAVVLVIAAFVVVAGTASADIASLWYKEAIHQGTIYVFNSAETLKGWQTSHEIKGGLVKKAYGPSGETVVFENETALDLYNLKHNKEPEARPARKPAIPLPSTSLRIGENGELKFGALLQAWYVTDSSPASTGTSQFGNTTGANTFRVRRAEIKLSGKIVKDWGFEVMFDPAKTQSSTAGQDGKILQDLAVAYSGFKGHELLLGQKKIYLTEEGVRSSAALDFAERSVVTRQFADRREIGLFWKGDWSPLVSTWISATNGTVANTNDDSNDTLNFAGRIDIKPAKGLLVGVSGSTSGGEGRSHLGRTRFGGHVRWEGTEQLPLGLRAEYYVGTDEQLSGAVRSDLKRNGWYASALYTFAKQFQVGVRYEEFDRNKDASSKLKVFTGGLHYLIKGNNANLKLDIESIKDAGRIVNGVLDESYVQGVIAAQVAF